MKWRTIYLIKDGEVLLHGDQFHNCPAERVVHYWSNIASDADWQKYVGGHTVEDITYYAVEVEWDDGKG